jgi:hypothetical protein
MWGANFMKLIIAFSSLLFSFSSMAATNTVNIDCYLQGNTYNIPNIQGYQSFTIPVGTRDGYFKPANAVPNYVYQFGLEGEVVYVWPRGAIATAVTYFCPDAPGTQKYR